MIPCPTFAACNWYVREKGVGPARVRGSMSVLGQESMATRRSGPDVAASGGDVHRSPGLGDEIGGGVYLVGVSTKVQLPVVMNTGCRRLRRRDGRRCTTCSIVRNDAPSAGAGHRFSVLVSRDRSRRWRTRIPEAGRERCGQRGLGDVQEGTVKDVERTHGDGHVCEASQYNAQAS